MRETFGKITQIDQKHYPETLGATIILNAGWVFSSVFKVVATFLDPRTRAKIQVLGSGKKDVAVLEEFLDLNQIPTFIGGHLRCAVCLCDCGCFIIYKIAFLAAASRLTLVFFLGQMRAWAVLNRY